MNRVVTKRLLEQTNSLDVEDNAAKKLRIGQLKYENIRQHTLSVALQLYRKKLQ